MKVYKSTHVCIYDDEVNAPYIYWRDKNDGNRPADYHHAYDEINAWGYWDEFTKQFPQIAAILTAYHNGEEVLTYGSSQPRAW